MKKNSAFRLSFQIEEVDNGYILVTGQDVQYLPSNGRYVFNHAAELKEFITDYLLGDI